MTNAPASRLTSRHARVFARNHQLHSSHNLNRYTGCDRIQLSCCHGRRHLLFAEVTVSPANHFPPTWADCCICLLLTEPRLRPVTWTHTGTMNLYPTCTPDGDTP